MKKKKEGGDDNKLIYIYILYIHTVLLLGGDLYHFCLMG